MTPKIVTPDPIATIKDELSDFDKQRIEAQQQATFWRDKFLVSDGAYQACSALLKKLDVQPLAGVPSEPKQHNSADAG